MIKLILRSISASKGRLALTMLSIIFGVAFVSGSFVLADSLRSVFDEVSEDIFAGTDAVVRAVEDEVSNSENPPRFDEDIAAALDNVEGVGLFEPGISGFETTYTTDADGEIVRPQGPPVLTFSWAGPSDLSSLILLEGEPPTGQQVAIDKPQAEQAGFAVGDTITLTTLTGELEEFELSGLVEFSSPGAFFIVFDLPTAQRVLDADGQIDGIVVAAEEGFDTNTLVDNLAVEVPEGIEVISAEQGINETQEQFGSFISIFGNILLGFALVTLFVSIFIIYNTFAILVSQRKKQMGLLRAIGASSKQVLGMVLLESLVVGVIASILGLFAGLGVASALKWLFSQGGGEFPEGPLELAPRTIIVVMIVGIFVTVVSAIAPALRASRTSPLEALRDAEDTERSMTRRIIAGAIVLVPGIVLLGLGLVGTSGSVAGVLSLLGFGSVLTFVGVAMLSALFAGRASHAIGLPVEAARKTVGRISRDNASRNPQRTAATATSLMIGLALITGVSVLATSIKATFNDLLGDALAADIFIFEEAQGLAFSANMVDQLDALPEVGSVAGFAELNADVVNYQELLDGADDTVGSDGTLIDTVTAFDAQQGVNVIGIDMLEGTAAVGPNEIAVREDRAEDLGVVLGDTVNLRFDDPADVSFEVVGIFDQGAIVEGNWLVERTAITDFLELDVIDFVGVNLSDEVTAEEGRAAVDTVAVNFPQLAVQDNSEFQEGIEGQVDSLLLVVNGLLGLCLIIAFFGIVNTMALSVLERTREIGLLRAVGMTRSQLRSSIRWEAVIVGLFGALLGVFMGVVLAWAGISALPEGFITSTAIPFGDLLTYVILGGVLGIVAAYFPARRAAKLNVLEAIATT